MLNGEFAKELGHSIRRTARRGLPTRRRRSLRDSPDDVATQRMKNCSKTSPRGRFEPNWNESHALVILFAAVECE